MCHLTRLCSRLVKALKGKVKRVSCGLGDAHTLVVDITNRAYSFGDADYGKLGREGDHDVPELMDFSSSVLQAEAGNQCSFLLTTKGEVFSCGSSDGALGVAGSGNRRRPAMVSGWLGVRLPTCGILCFTAWSTGLVSGLPKPDRTNCSA